MSILAVACGPAAQASSKLYWSRREKDSTGPKMETRSGVE
jgi:hypothetical protein